MKELILAGSGGCMRELLWQIQELNKEHPTWKVTGYVDCRAPEDGAGVIVGTERIACLGNDDFLLEKEEPVNVAICVGSLSLRKKLAEKFSVNPNIRFPNLILGDTRICEDVRMGKGCIISMGARISTNVVLGDFVFMNTGSMICHDGRIGDFVTLSPDVKLAGDVGVGFCSEIGMGAKVIQGIRIGENVMVGAGSVVIRNIGDKCTAVGVPARVR